MNYIGEKIKELRRSRDMTQEKLAEYLCVSYQTVSKWECGVSSPDVYTIAPLARLFGVSTDELLGVSTGDAQRAEFDRLHENYWQKDTKEMYQAAQEAVAAFPGDMKYLEWLASMEYCMATEERFRQGGGEEAFKSMMEKSVRHHKTVIENTQDAALKGSAVREIVESLKHLNGMEEARQYAALLPEEPSITRDEVLVRCYEGQERFEIQQRMLYKRLLKLLVELHMMQQNAPATDPCTLTVLDFEEAIIKAAVPDGNYLRFWWHLYMIYIKRGECAVASGEHDRAIALLQTAKEYALKSDSLNNAGVYHYTCPLFEGYADECNLEEAFLHDGENYWRWAISTRRFAPIQEREDFKRMLQ